MLTWPNEIIKLNEATPTNFDNTTKLSLNIHAEIEINYIMCTS